MADQTDAGGGTADQGPQTSADLLTELVAHL
ncbi:MAG: hypothetical protein QOE28_486, partial [Solirubrobacteraceae bacterium]|nr:hypothetical protein [Solirubrobacteraceae bacterium]